MRHRHPHLPWRDIRDAGNAYRHDYEGVRERIVFDTVHLSLPELQAAIDAELSAPRE